MASTTQTSGSYTPPEEKGNVEKRESTIGRHPSSDGQQSTVVDDAKLNAKLANPLAGLSHEQIEKDALAFASAFGLEHLSEEIRKGALVAQDPAGMS